jgi:hypothetical protein
LRNWASGYPLELDIFLPTENIAFEYHGEHHYWDVYHLGNYWQKIQRDKERREYCELNDITLFEIPYWWDKQVPSLLATIYKQRKDLIPDPGLGKSIPMDFEGIISGKESELMHGQEWDGEQDLTGW